MARPTKQGIDYFPLDCQFDDKIEMFIIEKGAIGIGVLVTVWQMIYSNEGYYIKDNKDLHLLIKRKIDVDINEIIECINICLSRQIFDEKLYRKHKILTSRAIQKRYFDAAKRKKSITVNDDFLLVAVNEYINADNVDINRISAGNNATNVKGDVKVDVDVDTLFAEFWKEYPKKSAKSEAQKAFKKVATEYESLMAGLLLHKNTDDWKKENGKFIPYPATWLNQRRWEDELNNTGGTDDRFSFLHENDEAA